MRSLTTGEASLRRIVLSDELPREGSGILIHYEHELAKVEGWTPCDVREIVSRNEDRWLSEIDSWHRNLSERAIKLTRWWPLLPGSRLILWPSTTPFGLKPILFALAVIELCNRRPTEITWIVGVPDEVAAYLIEWATQKKLVRIECKPTPTTANWRGHRIPDVFTFWVKLIKQIAFITIGVAFRKRAQVETAAVIVNSLALNPRLIRAKGDHFFGHMMDRIEGLSDKHMIWLYADTVRVDKKTRSELTAIKRRAHFISDYFQWRDLWFALRTALGIRKSLKPLLTSSHPLRAGELATPSFPVNFLISLVVWCAPLFELVLYRQWSRILKRSGADTVVYPYEEKPMERAMLLAVRDFAPDVRTIGFAHAAYSKGHLYLRRGGHGEPPRPNFVAVTGEIARKLFVKVGVPSGEIVVIGSPRYCDVSRTESPIESKPRKQILLLIGYGFELRIFAAMVENKPDLFRNYDLVIRRYPYAWFDDQDAAEARMRAAGIVYRCENGDLAMQIDESDVVLFESTSAGMEASLRGRLVIRLNLSSIVSTNHFYGDCNHDEIIFCRDADELKNQLEYISSLTPSQYVMNVQRQRTLVAGLYSPVDQAVVSNWLMKR